MQEELRMKGDLKLINALIEHYRLLNTDHLLYITEYFDKIINKIDIAAEKLICNKKSDEAKVLETQSELTDTLDKIKTKCLNSFISSGRSIHLTSQFSQNLKNLEDELKKILIDSDKALTNRTILTNFYKLIKKQIFKSENKLLSGYQIKLKFLHGSFFQDFEKYPLGCHLIIRCTTEYKKISSDDQLNEMEAELIYCFQAMNKVTFSKTILRRIYTIFSDTADSEEAINLLKLVSVLDVPKPDCPSLDITIFGFALTDDEIESLENMAVLLCLGILNGTYDISRNSIRNNLWNHFVEFFRKFGPGYGLDKHIFAFLRQSEIKFTKKQWETLEISNN